MIKRALSTPDHLKYSEPTLTPLYTFANMKLVRYGICPNLAAVDRPLPSAVELAV